MHIATSNNISSIHLNKRVENSLVCKKPGDMLGSMLSGVKQWPLNSHCFSLVALILGNGQA
jgi:hypothetical protein